jgi:hypothetical protein
VLCVLLARKELEDVQTQLEKQRDGLADVSRRTTEAE